MCEPYFDRPLAEISLGMVLMRLFQTSRRFQVEIQPQLVLLQKTLLNIEGLGHQARPQPGFVEHGQAIPGKVDAGANGAAALVERVAGQGAALRQAPCPVAPPGLRLLAAQKMARTSKLAQELLQEQRRTNRLLQGLVYGGLGFVLGMLAMQILTRVRVF